ncbi:TonB-dependent siderophore receptor [Flavobacterium crassostreae]|uniref:TonB-dependent receptor n=1 Tax=Flavobacterium crassostreae TaxID=1763534 RepID=A0A1B9E8X6_9FLAO|nr:TonB-dependent siderophore receptor [Flavobacterium crassostreae]OCB78389.1 TonB-dependent receptor [Flavobacterium crassostreae]
MKALLLGCVLLIASTSLQAQQIKTTSSVLDTLKNKKGESLKEVIIKTRLENKKISAVRSGIKPMDLPQSIQVIGSKIIAQQQAIRLSEVIKNANGVYVGSARGAAQETFWSRGYNMSSNNMFKNGFRFSSNSIPEVSSLDRVEILKGSAALLFGNVAPGGILNMVTKKPTFKKGGSLSMQMGSNAFYKPTVDYYNTINKNIAYRFIGSYENSDSYRDIVQKERYYLNPSLLFAITDQTQITVQGDYLHDNWTPDFGTGIIGKTIAPVGRNKYLGASWSNGQTRQSSVSTLVNHDFNANWKLNFNTSFQYYSQASKATERVQPDAKGDWKRPLGQNKKQAQLTAQQLSITGTFYTAKIKNQLFTGVDFENSFDKNYRFAFANPTYGSGNILNLDTFDPEGPIPDATLTKITTTDTNSFGVYAQDLISISSQFKVLAGIRWSWQEAKVTTSDFTTNPVANSEEPNRVDQAFTPRVGVVYQPNTALSLFASYANSFTPNSGTTVDLKAIEPSFIDQYEIGIKKSFWNNKWTTNLTFYQIENSQLAQTAEFKADGTTNTDRSLKILSGATKSKGIELDVSAKPIEGLNIMAGYSYNDMRFTKTSGTNGSYITGDRLTRTPSNTANLSFFYTLSSGILKGFSVGSTANYIGNRVAGWNNQLVLDKAGILIIKDREVPVKGYTTIDVSAGYTWKKFALLGKLSNITNTLNYTVHENYSANPIAPRQLIATLKYVF